MNTCEDYPCCGHQWGECDWNLTKKMQSERSRYVEQHYGCDHAAGVYYCEEEEDDDY